MISVTTTSHQCRHAIVNDSYSPHCRQSLCRRLIAGVRKLVISDTLEWKQLDPETQRSQTLIAERFLRSRVVDGEPLLFGDVPVANLQRKHIKAILARRSNTPHAASHLLRMIRKLRALLGLCHSGGPIEVRTPKT
jgi:hypothetical protein